MRRRSRPRRALGSLAPALVITLVVLISATGTLRAASSGTVVGATVPSATWLDPAGCASDTPGITSFGSVTPGASVVTPNDCVLKFGSSNDIASLHIAQTDGGGIAMMAAPATGVVGHWPLNGTGTPMPPGVIPVVRAGAGAQPTWVAGRPELGQALGFDGNDTSTIAHDASQSLDVFTVDMWFRTTTVANNPFPTLIEKDLGGGGFNRNYNIEFHRDAGNFTASVSVGGVYRPVATPSAGLVDGAWHHVAQVVDATTQYLYVDGQLRASVALGGNVDNPVAPIYVGSEPGRPFIGDVDEVRISSVARTPAEIRSWYLGMVDDYLDNGTADFDTVGSFDLFAACLRDATDGAAPGGGSWTEGPGNACPGTDGAHWKSIPTTAPGAKLASIAAPDAQGGATDPTVNLRFGFRTRADQPPGSYRAPLTFQVVAPAL